MADAVVPVILLSSLLTCTTHWLEISEQVFYRSALSPAVKTSMCTKNDVKTAAEDLKSTSRYPAAPLAQSIGRTPFFCARRGIR
jgi:hypothetical protein